MSFSPISFLDRLKNQHSFSVVCWTIKKSNKLVSNLQHSRILKRIKPNTYVIAYRWSLRVMECKRIQVYDKNERFTQRHPFWSILTLCWFICVWSESDKIKFYSKVHTISEAYYCWMHERGNKFPMTIIHYKSVISEYMPFFEPLPPKKKKKHGFSTIRLLWITIYCFQFDERSWSESKHQEIHAITNNLTELLVCLRSRLDAC